MRERWQALRLEREEGMALILAVVTTTVVTIMVVAMLSFTSASSRDANLKDARQSAYALAEAGVGQALAQLASHFYRDNGSDGPTPYQAPPDDDQPINDSTVFDSSWFATTNSQKSSTDGSPCTYDASGTLTSTCVTWSVTPEPDSPEGIKEQTLLITGTGTVLNPTGAAPLVQTVTAKVDVQKKPVLVKTPEYWKEIYYGDGPSNNCDFTLDQGVEITAPLYSGGNLCLENSAKIYGSDVTLKVLGWAWVKNPQGFIGKDNDATYARLNSAQILAGCSSAKNKQPSTVVGSCTVNKSGDNVWDSTPTSQHAATAPTADPLPVVDFVEPANRQLSSLSCTNGRSPTTETTFSLTPAGASYSCESQIGSINWDSAAHVLTVDGEVSFSGNLLIDTSNTPTTYEGHGSFFVNGTITTANNAYLCVKVRSGECDFANALDSNSSGFWDATKNLLLLQARAHSAGPTSTSRVASTATRRSRSGAVAAGPAERKAR